MKHGVPHIDLLRRPIDTMCIMASSVIMFAEESWRAVAKWEKAERWLWDEGEEYKYGRGYIGLDGGQSASMNISNES